MKVVSTGKTKISLGDSQLNLFQLDKAKSYVLTIQDKDSDTLILTGVDENGEYEFKPESSPVTDKQIVVSDIKQIILSDVKLDELKNLYEILGKEIKEQTDN
jgi:hypothetical protein